MTQTRDEEGRWSTPDDNAGTGEPVANAFMDALAASRSSNSHALAADLIQRMETDAIAAGLIPDPNAAKAALREALTELLAEQQEESTNA